MESEKVSQFIQEQNLNKRLNQHQDQYENEAILNEENKKPKELNQSNSDQQIQRQKYDLHQSQYQRQRQQSSQQRQEQDYDKSPPNKYYYVQLIGQPKTGKTSIFKRLAQDILPTYYEQDQNYTPTQCISLQRIKCGVLNNQYKQTVLIQFIDTNGNSQSLAQTKEFSDISDTVIFVYNQNSIQNAKQYFLKNWSQYVKNVKEKQRNKWRRVVLCLNKFNKEIDQQILFDQNFNLLVQIEPIFSSLGIQFKTFIINCCQQKDTEFDNLKYFLKLTALNQFQNTELQSQSYTIKDSQQEQQDQQQQQLSKIYQLNEKQKIQETKANIKNNHEYQQFTEIKLKQSNQLQKEQQIESCLIISQQIKNQLFQYTTDQMKQRRKDQVKINNKNDEKDIDLLNPETCLNKEKKQQQSKLKQLIDTEKNRKGIQIKDNDPPSSCPFSFSSCIIM